MWRIVARLQYTKDSYSFKVTVHQIIIELKSHRFKANSFYSFHQYQLRLRSYKAHIVSRFQYIKHIHLLHMFCYPAVAGYHAVSAMLLLNISFYWAKITRIYLDMSFKLFQ